VTTDECCDCCWYRCVASLVDSINWCSRWFAFNQRQNSSRCSWPPGSRCSRRCTWYGNKPESRSVPRTLVCGSPKRRESLPELLPGLSSVSRRMFSSQTWLTLTFKRNMNTRKSTSLTQCVKNPSKYSSIRVSAVWKPFPVFYNSSCSTSITESVNLNRISIFAIWERERNENCFKK
jgi:hypothetical protein